MSLAATLIWLRMNRDDFHKKVIRENVEFRKLVGEKSQLVEKGYNEGKDTITKARIEKLLKDNPTIGAAIAASGMAKNTFYKYRNLYGL